MSHHCPTCSQLLGCPNCKSKKLVKNGKRYNERGGGNQRFGCLACGTKFSLVDLRSVFSEEIKTRAIALVVGGMTYRAAVEFLRKKHKLKISHVTLLRWVQAEGA